MVNELNYKKEKKKFSISFQKNFKRTKLAEIFKIQSSQSKSEFSMSWFRKLLLVYGKEELFVFIKLINLLFMEDIFIYLRKGEGKLK